MVWEETRGQKKLKCYIRIGSLGLSSRPSKKYVRKSSSCYFCRVSHHDIGIVEGTFVVCCLLSRPHVCLFHVWLSLPWVGADLFFAMLLA